ncbi:Uma2 family endonuclease [Tundrisphaera lichenicola]|uniref:Uma2 family endonuclease n=1 Tax=Tundrisphaera lichenicola TaxID=2029860 RepID=UPI003EBBC5CC
MSSVLDRSPIEAPSSPVDVPYLFSVDDFYRMIDNDIFPDDARVGLWEGRVYEEMAKKHPHSFSWARLNAALFPILPPGWSLWAESSITLSADKVPLPDMVILRGDLETYRDRRPVAADVGLLIELADTSLKIDTGAKLRAYARAGIPAYWVFNLKEDVIYLYSDPIPSEERYSSTTTIGRDGSIPFVLEGAQVALIPTSNIL